MLDTVVSVETPEGILLELRPAGLSARVCAFMIDLGVRMLIFFVAAIPIALMGNVGIAVLLLLLFGLEWLYPVIFELSQSGATPGKRTVGLKVVMDSGLPVTPAASLARNILRAADFLPFFYGGAVASILWRDDCKRLGDLAAGTLVIFAPRRVAHGSAALVPPVAPARSIAPADQAAVVALAMRASTLTSARLDELAALAAPITGDQGRHGPDVTRRVLGVAQWLLGRRG